MLIVFALAILSLGAPAQSAASPQAPPATVEAWRNLAGSQQWTELDARIAALSPDDPAWERLAGVLYQAAITRKNLPWVIARVSGVAAATTNNSIKAAALIVVGRAQRRQGDLAAAAQALESAKAAAPGTPYAEEAAGLAYEVAHLSPGLPAPAFAAKARNRRAIDLSALRGKPVVLVFWGTT